MRLIPGKGQVLGAIGFDEQTAAVVAATRSFARLFGLPARLVHVVNQAIYELQGTDEAAAAADYLGDDLPTKAELLGAAQGELEALLASLSGDVELSGCVLYGPNVQAITQEAQSCGAVLIVSAFAPDEYNALSADLSTTIGLMQGASLPVLAVSRDAAPDFGREGFRLLVADDLQPGTQAAVRTAYQVAAGLTRANVCQLHVRGGGRGARPDSSRESSERASCVSGLQEQAGPARQLAVQAGATVDLKVKVGRVGDELHAAIADFAPDLVVFGRHHWLHVRPLQIGRMSYRAMLGERRAVLLVPPGSDFAAPGESVAEPPLGTEPASPTRQSSGRPCVANRPNPEEDTP